MSKFNFIIQGDAGAIDHSDFLVLIKYPDRKPTLISISEGTGDNLLPEDIDAGYTDYICYDFFDVENNCVMDGGQILLRESYIKKDLFSIIWDILDYEGYTTRVMSDADIIAMPVYKKS